LKEGSFQINEKHFAFPDGGTFQHDLAPRLSSKTNEGDSQETKIKCGPETRQILTPLRMCDQ